VVDAVVTTRRGGVSEGTYASLNLGLHVDDDPRAVVENRRRAAASLGCTLDDLVIAEQVHGNRVAVVGADDAGRGAHTTDDAVARTDALVTTTPSVAVAVLVADCVPLVLLDPAAGVLGVVHAGWRGTAAGVTPAAVATMVDRGADPQRLVVGIGPAVDPDRYEVGTDVADALRAALGDAALGDADGGVLTPTAPGRWRCDLVAANRLALRRIGVRPDNIHTLPVTTADPDLFSHRAGDGGRFAVLARLTPDPTLSPSPQASERTGAAG
jgi:YfiH family protein